MIASKQVASDWGSPEHPEHDDRARRPIWQQLHEELYYSLDCTFVANEAFSVRSKVVRFGPALVDEFKGTITRTMRSVRNIAADGNDHFLFFLNCGTQPMTHSQGGREVVHLPGSLVLLSNSDPYVARNDPRNVWLSVHVPRGKLIELVANADDLVARQADKDHPGVRFLRNYLKLLLDPDIGASNPQLKEHIGETLIDLVALCLGAGREAAEIAQARGLRFARLQAIKSEIDAGFNRPGFSIGQVAKNVGVTPRYIQELLHVSGETFTERVLELKLQEARMMLAIPRYDHLKIIEIALTSGFNGVSYFNRCFRHRFGDTPRGYRGKTIA